MKKLPDSEFETDQCLDYLKKIDNSFNDDKSCRNEIAKAMIDTNYPGIKHLSFIIITKKNLFSIWLLYNWNDW